MQKAPIFAFDTVKKSVSSHCGLIYDLKSRGYSDRLPYSREQKHALLFRKSEILLFKVLITSMPHVFQEQNFFVFKDRELKFSASY